MATIVLYISCNIYILTYAILELVIALLSGFKIINPAARTTAARDDSRPIKDVQVASCGRFTALEPVGIVPASDPVGVTRQKLGELGN